MGQQRYTDEFKREAVRQVTEKGHPVGTVKLTGFLEVPLI